MKLEKKEDQVTLLLFGQLTGHAWTVCEIWTDKPDELEKPEAFDKLMKLLDSRFQYKKETELPDAFE